MRYRVDRASNYKNAKPCDGAYSVGKNEYGENIWCVDINSLDELHHFIEMNGDIVLFMNSNWCDLLIYDGYIE